MSALRLDQVKTNYGYFTPCSDASDLRKKYRLPVEYYPDGTVRSVYLQDISEVTLPSGTYQAEFMTFYEDGSIKRLFPLYGQLSSYWGVEDEAKDAPEYVFTINKEQYKLRPQCIFFYPSGKIRSITLWPDDLITVATSLGPVKTALGIEMYEDGSIRSIEPSYGTVFSTCYGDIKPFIIRKHMMHAENASTVFSGTGELQSTATLSTSVTVNDEVYRASDYRSPLVLFFSPDHLGIRGVSEQDIWVDTSENEVRFR